MTACRASSFCRDLCSARTRATDWAKPKSRSPVRATAARSATQMPNRSGPRARTTTGVVIAVASTPAARAAYPLTVPAPKRGAFRSGAGFDALSEEGGEALNYKLQHGLADARVDADEEGVPHDSVG